MNKSELIEAVASQTSLTKADVGRLLTAITDTIATTIAGGEKVTITGFGTFKGSVRAARTGTNPKTGQPIEIGEHTVVSFKAGSDLKSKV